jgi:hypothetical protein
MTTLESLVDNSRTDKNTIHSYLPLYESLLSGKRESAKNVLEIGICLGGSIKLWRDYFTSAQVYGVDIVKRGTYDWRHISKDSRITLYDRSDAYDINFFNSNFRSMKFDFILDDGPHTLESMKAYITLYSQVLAHDGILILEDIQDILWIESLKSCVPVELKEFVNVYDLRATKGRYDDIVLTIDCSKRIQTENKPL